MSGITLSNTLGGILLVSGLGIPVFAQDSTGNMGLNVSISDRSTSPPFAEPMVQMPPSLGRTPQDLMDCPPEQVGCFSRFKQRCRAKYWGYPEEFQTPPLGASVACIRATQVCRGQAARMVLYHYDFLSESDQLNPRGKAHLAKIAMWLTTTASPIQVEPTPTNPGLDESRREAVWRELSNNQVSIPFEQIIVSRPEVSGLGANDALLMDRNRLSLTSSRGVSAGGGGTATSSTSTGSSAGTASGGSTGRSN